MKNPLSSYQAVCRPGTGVLFATTVFMALANSAFALTVPKPKSSAS